MDKLNEDPRFQSYISAEEDDRKIKNSIKKEYYEKGYDEGHIEAKIEDARMMLKDNVSIEKISQYTGLSDNRRFKE